MLAGNTTLVGETIPCMNEPKSRLRELLAIPERDRTEAEWDELNELEIALASGNQKHAQQNPPQGGGQSIGRPRSGNNPGHNPRGIPGNNPGNNPGSPKPGKKFHRGRRKPPPPR